MLTGQPYHNRNPFPDDHGQALQLQWKSLQGELLGLSSAASQWRADEAAHFVHRDQPEAIVAAVQSLVVSLTAAPIGASS